MLPALRPVALLSLLLLATLGLTSAFLSIRTASVSPIE